MTIARWMATASSYLEFNIVSGAIEGNKTDLKFMNSNKNLCKVDSTGCNTNSILEIAREVLVRLRKRLIMNF